MPRNASSSAVILLRAIVYGSLILSCVTSFTWSSFRPLPAIIIRQPQQPQEKSIFLTSLEQENAFNAATKERSRLLNAMLSASPTARPGSVQSFKNIAPGTWRIIYAPHIYTLSSLVGGEFDPVLYEMKSDGTIVSHAKYSFPVIGQGWLSVSGRYGSEDDRDACRVDFDRAWVQVGAQNDGEPIGSYDGAPDYWYKDMINSLGQMGFRREFAVFPVSYLDEDTIVFDFELFGTRICARKV